MKMTIIFILIVVVFGCVPNQRPTSGIQHTDYYLEQYRPQFHFTPDSGWMNDPNGMVYYDGEYHLFYQHYPDDNVWGPMHWGHAISTDLVHWEHQPIALYPDSLGLIFSGSAVVDKNNTSELGSLANPPLIAIYTIHDMEKEKAGEINFQSQGIAYSLDKGRTWNKYENNPVLKNPGIRDFRDPKVSWVEDSKKWIMTLAVHDHVEFYSSSNLIDWKKESEFGNNLGAHGGVWECPDLFQMKVQGSDESKWVLLVSINPGGPNGGSAVQYFVGDFDGQKFTSDQTGTKWLDYGRDDYAGVTWNDIPKEDGRRLFIGWMSNWSYATSVPTVKWRSACTLPRELILDNLNGDFIVRSLPIEELKNLRQEKINFPSQQVSEKVNLETEDMTIMCSEMSLNFNLQYNTQSVLASDFGIIFSNEKGENFKIGYLAEQKLFYTDRNEGGISSFSDDFAGKHTAPYVAGNEMDIKIYIDESSVEVFVDKGKLVMTEIVFPTEPYNKVKLFAKDGFVDSQNAEIWSLKSVWNK